MGGKFTTRAHPSVMLGPAGGNTSSCPPPSRTCRTGCDPSGMTSRPSRSRTPPTPVRTSTTRFRSPTPKPAVQPIYRRTLYLFSSSATLSVRRGSEQSKPTQGCRGLLCARTKVRNTVSNVPSSSRTLGAVLAPPWGNPLSRSPAVKGHPVSEPVSRSAIFVLLLDDSVVVLCSASPSVRRGPEQGRPAVSVLEST